MSAWADEAGRDVPYGYGSQYGSRWADAEPRWGPDRPLAERITKRGRWADVDPTVRGGVWSRYKWGTLVLYAGYMGALFGIARSSQGAQDLTSTR